jgi:transposase-like protein
VWLIAGVERTINRKMFAVQVEDRSADTICQVIEKHVHPGSIIHTDCWKGYMYLDKSEEYEHRTVNHSEYFKDPITQVHTNTVEGTWAAIKLRIAKRYRCESGLQNHLPVFIWRRQNDGRLWEALLAALKDYHWIE